MNKLPGVTGQAFDVASLSFGVEGIEGEGTFTGAADTGEADQFVARQNEIDILQIMFPCAFDDDVGHESIIPSKSGGRKSGGENRAAIFRLRTKPLV